MMDALTRGEGWTDAHTAPMALARGKRFVVTNASIENRVPSVMIIFSILIVLVNLGLVALVLVSKALRNSSKHVLVISLCLADLIMGVFVIPVVLSMSSGGEGEEREMDCSLFYAVRLFAELLIPSVTTLAVLALNVDYILRLCHSAYSEGSSRVCLLLLLFLLPWLVSCVLLNPLYVDALEATGAKFWWERCTITIQGPISRTLFIISFFPQAATLLLVNIIVSILYLVRRESHSLDAMGERIRAPVDICLASFVTILFYTPSFLHQLLSTEGYRTCQDSQECQVVSSLQLAALFIMLAKSWALPLCWLASKDTCAAIRHVFDC